MYTAGHVRSCLKLKGVRDVSSLHSLYCTIMSVATHIVLAVSVLLKLDWHVDKVICSLAIVVLHHVNIWSMKWPKKAWGFAPLNYLTFPLHTNGLFSLLEIKGCLKNVLHFGWLFQTCLFSRAYPHELDLFFFLNADGKSDLEYMYNSHLSHYVSDESQMLCVQRMCCLYLC